MKKLLFIVSVLAILVTACLPVTTPTTPSEPPVAYIDSVLPPAITQGEKLTFSGHGTAKTGSVVAFQWRSSQDGIISNAPSFSTSGLSVARHTIYFRVQNNTGEWSPEVYFFINVVPTGASKPVINTFEFNPQTITAGNQVTMNWNVTNASKVSISPDIGDVPSVGSRVLSPKSTTVYTLIATNEVGNMTKEAMISISSTPVNTIELSAIARESMSVKYDGITSPLIQAGVLNQTAGWQPFLSYDISGIPQNAVIKNASIDLSYHEIYGRPFPFLGEMGVFPLIFSRIGTRNFVGVYPGGAVLTFRSEPIQAASSGMLITTIQELVSRGSARFEIRIQFQKYFYIASEDNNYLLFSPDRTKLAITYEQ